MDIRVGKIGEEAALCALADRSFGYESGWFQHHMAKFYGGHLQHAPYHIVAEEDGKLVGMAALYRQHLWVEDTVLSMLGVGTVCTDPDYRKRGILQAVMTRIVEWADEQDADFVFLEGKYHRYHHFGFEAAGMHHEETVQAAPNDAYSFVPLDEMTAEECRFVQELEDSRPVHGVRPLELFAEIHRLEEARTYFVRKNGDAEGAIMLGKAGDVVLEVTTKSEPKAAIQALLASLGVEKAKVMIPLYDEALLQAFPQALPAQQRGEYNGCMIRTKHFGKLLSAWLSYRAKRTSLPSGKLSLQLGEEALTVCVQGSTVAVCAAAEAPALRFSHDEAVKLLFLPCADNAPSSEAEHLLQAWFPLPLFIKNGDDF